MFTTHTYMAAAGDADDKQLTSLLRRSFLAQPQRERSNWLKQIELSLDGYGDRHRDAAARIRNILRLLPLEQHGVVNFDNGAARGQHEIDAQ